MRSKLLIAGFLLILIVVNGLIMKKENDLAGGCRVVLELAPRDPRSLMQGDYMVLNYALANQIRVQNFDDGLVYLQPGGNDLAKKAYRGFAKGRQKLRYREHNGRILFGVEDFFFQEGQRQHFDQARYGELRIDPDGRPTLVNLLDKDLKPL